MTRNLNRLIAAIAAVLLSHVVVGQTAPSYRNSIVAEVNDKIITRQMVMDAMKPEETAPTSIQDRAAEWARRKDNQDHAILDRVRADSRVEGPSAAVSGELDRLEFMLVFLRVEICVRGRANALRHFGLG